MIATQGRTFRCATWRRTVVALATWAACAAAAPPHGKAHGDGKPRHLAEELHGAALEAYEQGKALFEHGDFGTAHAKFKQAFVASKHARLLWNMAACSAKQKHYALAIAEVEQHLTVGAGTLTAEQVAKARAFRDELRGFVAEASFVVTPNGARLSVDHEPVEARDPAKPVYLDVGPHEIVVECEGYETLREGLVVRDVGKMSFTFSLKPSVAVVPPSPPSSTHEGVPSAPAPAALAAPSPSVGARAITGWSFVGVGIAAIAGGVVEHVVARGAADAFASKCQGKTCDSSAAADYDRAESAATFATGLYVGGAIAAGVGIVLLATGGEGERAAVAVSVSPTGLRIGGTF